MVQTVLGGAAVAVHREGYQNPCLDAEAFFLHDARKSPNREADVPAEQDWTGPTGASRAADSGNPTNPLH